MHSLNVVEYDRNRGMISMPEHVDEFDIYLDVVPQNDLPWSQFYLALGAVLTALVSVAALGIMPFAALSGFGYALLATGTVTIVAGYHTLRDRRLLLGSTEMPPDALLPPSDDNAPLVPTED
jgi:hypothetical protein